MSKRLENLQKLIPSAIELSAERQGSIYQIMEDAIIDLVRKLREYPQTNSQFFFPDVETFVGRKSDADRIVALFQAKQYQTEIETVGSQRFKVRVYSFKNHL